MLQKVHFGFFLELLGAVGQREAENRPLAFHLCLRKSTAQPCFRHCSCCSQDGWCAHLARQVEGIWSGQEVQHGRRRGQVTLGQH